MHNVNMKKISLLITISLLISGCIPRMRTPWFQRGGPGFFEVPLDEAPSASNGERIYFTAMSARGTRITYRGGPAFGGMMGAYLTCAACHGPEGRGGTHMMMHMQIMNAPDIRYAALVQEEHEEGNSEAHEEGQPGYGLEEFYLAVIEGKHPDGEPLSSDMPRWQMSEEDLADLFAFLQSLP